MQVGFTLEVKESKHLEPPGSFVSVVFCALYQALLGSSRLLRLVLESLLFGTFLLLGLLQWQPSTTLIEAWGALDSVDRKREKRREQARTPSTFRTLFVVWLQRRLDQPLLGGLKSLTSVEGLARFQPSISTKSCWANGLERAAFPTSMKF